MTNTNDSNRTRAKNNDETETDTRQTDDKPSVRYGVSRNTTKSETENATKNPKTTNCPECGGNLFEDDQHGETTCVDCGLVVDEEEIDPGPEWRSFNEQEKNNKKRVGAPKTKTRHDDGLTTNIGWQDKDAYGNALSPEKKQQMKRLRKWDERYRTRNPKERKLKQALGEIDRMASALGLPQNVRETTSMIYRQAVQQDMLPGRSIEGMASAALYAGARLENVPRSLDEIETVSRIEKERIARDYRYLNRELALEVGPIDPEKYIPRFTSELDVDKHTVHKAEELLDFIKANTLHNGKSPPGIAASVIYTACVFCNEDVTQKDVAEVTGITEVTIREGKDMIIEEGDESWILSDYTETPQPKA